MTSEAMCASSVCSVRRNLRRAGTLKKRSRTVMTVPFGSADSSQRKIFPPAISTVVPVVSSAARVSSSSRDTAAMEGSASPRNPSVEMASRSSASRNLLVAWRSKASKRVVAEHAAAVIRDADEPSAAAIHFDRECRLRRHRGSFREVPLRRKRAAPPPLRPRFYSRRGRRECGCGPFPTSLGCGFYCIGDTALGQQIPRRAVQIRQVAAILDGLVHQRRLRLG